MSVYAGGISGIGEQARFYPMKQDSWIFLMESQIQRKIQKFEDNFFYPVQTRFEFSKIEISNSRSENQKVREIPAG